MRLFYLILLVVASGCLAPKMKPASIRNLDGTWEPVREEIGGTVLAPAAYDKQRMVLLDSTYTFTAESVDRGVVRRHGNQMDVYGKEGVNAGKHFTAVYELNHGLLTICYDLSGQTYPGAFDTRNKPTYFLCSFKKVSDH